MQILNEPDCLRAAVAQARAAGKTVALVPTMGNLHAGHMALVAAARKQADFVITSIFVNPLQFGPNEDLEAYPRTFDEDCKLLQSDGCDAVFAPSVEAIYGNNTEQQSRIHVPGVSDNYCGASRPGHFDGVATIVCKLLNLCSPDLAFFGLKDYQQFLVIQKMVRDLAMNVQIAGVEIVREENGLAMSSRNGYLSPEQRQQAAAIHQCLQATAAELRSGNRNFQALEASARTLLEQAGLQADYYAICNASNLQAATPGDDRLVILAAAYLGPSRLIDNLRLTL
ncbi:MAG: pantoate--beta-alanine ligase [Pseudomonadales bacterium]|nr:pantoate--beta-alanine ligase [Pseudomonadales bacterium]